MTHRLFTCLSAISFLAVGAACQTVEDLGNRASVADAGDGSVDSTAPGTALRVFVTRSTHAGDLATNGGKGSPLGSADAICETAASGAGLDGRFIAYLSSGTDSASGRIVDDGPFFLVDGRTLAYENKAAIGGGSKVELRNEVGEAVYDVPGPAPASFWTGSFASGVPSGQDCQRWTSKSLFDKGSHASYLGRVFELACEREFHLLCVEQKSSPRAGNKKRIFITSQGLNGNFAKTMPAHQVVDAHCNAAAKTAALGGSWIAWFTAKDASEKVILARDRIADASYTLLDGREVFAKKKDLDGEPIVSIDVNEYGAKSKNVPVWTGTSPGGAPASPACYDWTTSSTTGAAGYNGSIQDWTGDRLTQCYEAGRIYCFEQ